MSDDINNNNKMMNYLIHKPKDQVIDKFEEYLSFLNNDEPSWILYEGILYPSVSVAFQGARAQDFEMKQKIADVDSPDDLIQLASEVEDPLDWENRRLKVMEILIRDKFRRSLEMRERLRLTEEKQLVCRFYEESASNLFWGVVGNKGQNQIGRILEKVRADIHQNVDLKKWMQTKFPLEQDKILLPIITLNVQKDGEVIETISLKERSYYYMGQYKTNSVVLAHPSISRLHACLICEEGNKVRLVDMESKSGSFVNGEILEKLFDKELQTGDILSFALSTRSYEILIDYTAAKQELQKRSIQLQQQVKQLQRLNQPSITPEELRKIMGFDIDNTLFISGLPDNATVLGIREMFERLSEPKNKDENEKKKYQGVKIKVQEVKIPVDKWSGRPKGFAYVTFQTREDFNNAQLYSFGLKYGEVKLKVKIADKDKSAQLMNNFKIKEENNSDDESRKRQNEKRAGIGRSRRDKSNERYKDRSSERQRDSKYKRRGSKSRSRSNDKKLRDRVSKFGDNQDKEQSRQKEEVKYESKNKKPDNDLDQDKKNQPSEQQKRSEKESSNKVKENKDKRKRSYSRDHKKKQDQKRDRSGSKSKNHKSSSHHEKQKKKSKSPRSKRDSSQMKNETKKSSKQSKSRSRDRERGKNRKDNKDTSKRSCSKDKIDSKSQKPAVEKQSNHQSDKKQEKESSQNQKQTKDRKRKQSESSNSSSSQSSRSSSSNSNSSNSRSSSSFSSSSSSQSSS